MATSRSFLAFLLLTFSVLSLWFAFSSLKKSEVSVMTMENRKYYPYLISSLQTASKSINVVMFEAKYYRNYKDSKVNDILDNLISARKRGVDVRIILEGGEDFLGADFAKSSQATCDYLTNGGVLARFDPKNITTHAKLIVIDNSSIIIGSTNWNYNAVENNNEASVLINSPSLAMQYASYFDSIWKDSKDCAGQ